MSNLLMELGWKGVANDLESRTVERLRSRFSGAISEGSYIASNQDYLTLSANSNNKFYLIISCMVMEHLHDELEYRFMNQSLELLKNAGLMIGLVQASPEHWGIEDDIAGHCRRYTRDDLYALSSKNGSEIRHLAGLTCPVSNVLLSLSNFLVRRVKNSKITMSDLEKIKASGIRIVRFKTGFPNVLPLLLNRYVLLPRHWLQKIFSPSRNALVLYFEANPINAKVD